MTGVNLEQMRSLALQFARTLKPGSIVALFGDLGAGKTTFLKAVISELTALPEEGIASPTFTYLNIYENIYHFDLYRLRGPEDFLALGFDAYFEEDDGITFLEWSERIEEILPRRAIRLKFSYAGSERNIEVIYP